MEAQDTLCAHDQAISLPLPEVPRQCEGEDVGIQRVGGRRLDGDNENVYLPTRRSFQ